MKTSTTAVLALCTGLLATPLWAGAQNTSNRSVVDGAPSTRGEVRMDRDEFLRTHRWDESTDTWVMNSDIQPPAGVRPRSDVNAARDNYLRSNRWDESSQRWVPVNGTPRDIGAMSREQVRTETAQFLRTHHWNESSEAWEPKAAGSRAP